MLERQGVSLARKYSREKDGIFAVRGFQGF